MKYLKLQLFDKKGMNTCPPGESLSKLKEKSEVD